MFARILAEELLKPGVEAFAVFREVQLRAKDTMKQELWMSLNYIPRIYLAAAPKAPEPVQSAPALPSLPVSEAAQTWQQIKDLNDPRIFEAFRSQYGGANPVYDRLASRRLEELKGNGKAEEPTAVPGAPPAPIAVAPGKTGVMPKQAATKPAQSELPLAAVETPAPTGQAAAIAPGEVAVAVLVTGAPGDGKTSLAEAMKRALRKQGIVLASLAYPGTYKIQGWAGLGTPANGQQSIVIRWIVIDPHGTQMQKTVVQNNRIAAGSLDGAWGDTADLAAGSAASEIAKLIPRSSVQAR